MRALLECIVPPAFVLAQGRQVVLANRAARDLMHRRSGVAKEVAAGVDLLEGAHAFVVIPLQASGLPGHVLAIWQQRERARGGSLPARWCLTPRQTQVFEAMMAGLANKDIAARLGLCPRTVEVHMSAILGKAGARSRAELMAAALRDGDLSVALRGPDLAVTRRRGRSSGRR